MIYNHHTSPPLNQIPVFVKFDTYVLESITARQFSSNEKDVLHTLIRLSAGFHQEYATISLKGLDRRIGIDKANLSRIVKKLRNDNVLLVKKGKHGAKYKIRPVDQWKTPLKKGVVVPVAHFYTPGEEDFTEFDVEESLPQDGAKSTNFYNPITTPSSHCNYSNKDATSSQGVVKPTTNKEIKENKETTTTTNSTPVDPHPGSSSSFSSSFKKPASTIKESTEYQSLEARLAVVEQALKQAETYKQAEIPVEKPPITVESQVLPPTSTQIKPPAPTVEISNEKTNHLVLPSSLDEKHKTNILKMLNGHQRGQSLVDELASRLETTEIRNPTSYISKLIQLETKGLFNPTAEKSVAETQKSSDMRKKIERWKDKKYDYAFHQTAEFITLEEEITAYYHEIGHHAPNLWRSFN